MRHIDNTCKIIAENSNPVSQLIKHTEQCLVYMQIACLKVKLLIVAVFMLM